MMSKYQSYLLATALFTLLFIGLVALGAYLLSIHNKAYALATFLFAFAAVIGQVGMLALTLREHARRRFSDPPKE